MSAPSRPTIAAAHSPCSRPSDTTIVLLVDDQAFVGEAIKRLLAGERDIVYHFCQHPEDAIARAIEVAPTVILQDLVMPSMDGLELLRRFRADLATADIPIIVLSSKEDATAKHDAFAAGATDYIVKIPDRLELVARIRSHSAGYLAQSRRNEIAAQLRESQAALAERVLELQAALGERSRYRVELEAANARLERESFLDSLTELLNRRGLEHQLAMELGRATRERIPLFAVLLDCDNLKDVNDRYGHDTGDRVIQEVARRISSAVRKIDHVARVGGDEFLVVLAYVDASQAAMLAERMRANVEQVPIVTPTHTVLQTVSVAIFEVPIGTTTTTDVLAIGTVGLRESKMAGKNRVHAQQSS